ncbi:MAG: hypothetical protein K6B69_07100 [Lachnospiraceae bacterium]|nr:hypothetical protein [Lachnospiraceae bacterium]
MDTWTLMWTIIGILVGIIIGIGLALRITVQNIKASNDIGDSRGELEDFHAVVNIIDDKDDLKNFNRDRCNRPRLEANFQRLHSAYCSDSSQS